MTNSYIRLSQIRRADVFTDNLSQSTLDTIESTAVDQEDIFTAEITQLRRIIGGSKWYSPIETAPGVARSLSTLTTDIYYKSILRRRQLLTNVAVPATQQHVVLSFASGQTPTEVIAIASGAEGAVVAQLAGAVGSADLTGAVAGLNSIFPKNQLLLRDSTTFEALLSSGREIYGLLQVGSGATDGGAFDDATNAAQITFVRENTAGNALELCPAADIAGKTIEYTYTSRTKFNELNEQDLLNGTYMDSAAITAISLEQAYKGGNTISVTTAEGDVTVALTQTGTDFAVTGLNGTVLDIQRGASDNIFAITNTSNVTVTGGKATIDGGVQANAINVGVGTGVGANSTISAATATGLKLSSTAGPLNLAATGVIEILTTDSVSVDATLDIGLFAQRDLQLSDQYGQVNLNEATANIAALPYGPYTSIAGAIKKALTQTTLNLHIMLVTSNFASGANMPGSGNWAPALNLSTKNISMNAADISTLDTVFMLNGRVVIGGDTSGDSYDIIKGTTPANGDIKFNLPKGIKSGDIVLALSWKA